MILAQKEVGKKLSSDPWDLSHELRAAPERVVAPGMRKTDGSRPFRDHFWSDLVILSSRPR